MALTNAGRDQIAADLIGEAVTDFDSANAHVGVGDSTVAFAATQTDLQAASNKLRKPMDATFPSRAVNALTFQSTFGTADANFTWNEWGVFNALAAGVMLNRKVEVLGTKTSAQTWQINVTLTVTAV